jgi:phage FluMu gp28-like protein
LHLAILDEAADIAETIWTNVVKPMLLETKGSALILGTPRGTSNWLHKLYRLGEEKPGAPYGSARMATRENPLVPAEDLEVFRIDMSEAEFRQEFEAEFIDGVDAVFKFVAESVGGAKREFGRPGFRYIHGIDLGQSKDYTAIASLAIREDNTGRNCVDGFARFNGEQWSVQCERIVEHVRRFPGPCVVDTTGVGRPIFEQLCGSIGYPMRAFYFSPDAKLDVVQGLAVAFENKRIIIPNERELIGELQSFQQTGWSAARRTPQYGAPSGLHDDGVIALGLAWWGLTRSGMATEGSGNPWREGWLHG